MSKTQKDIVLLLTGTINTQHKFYTALTDSRQRQEEYIATIRYYLSEFDLPVVFVENSNTDITPAFADHPAKDRLEIFTFDGNDYPADLGKGLGEMRCVEHGIKNSRLIVPTSFVLKITGRYKIRNLSKYITFYRKNPSTDIMADLTNNFAMSPSGLFGFRPSFAEKYLFKYTGILNDSKKWYFEHVLAKAVLEAIGDKVSFRLLKYYPRTSAVSGTTGKPYKESFFYHFPRNIKYLIRYFITR